MALTAIEIDINITLKEYASEAISADLFGANFLLGRDSFTGSYVEKIDQLGATTIRYPGGDIAEKHFDLLNPNNVQPSWTGTYDTLSDFLNFCEETGRRPSIVIPTEKYSTDIEKGKADLSEFISKLSAGEYGPTNGLIIEIGNEYYAGKIEQRLSAQEYGNIASEFAKIIENTASIPVKIGVQLGATDADNEVIANYFDTPEEISAVDMLILHDYSWTEESIAGRLGEKIGRVSLWEDKGMELEVFMSEWNIGSGGQNAISQHDYGLAQASALIEFVSEATKLGIDIATVWAIQQNNLTSLTENVGDMKINFGGVVFQMMSESLVGTKALSLPGDYFGHDDITVQAFESAEQVIVFVSANDFDEETSFLDVNIDLSGFESYFTQITGDRIYTNGDPNDWRADALVDSFAPNVVGGSAGIVKLSFYSDHEVVRLVFDKIIPGDYDPYIFGTKYADTLIGGNSANTMHGYFGNDRFFGGESKDKAFGSQGDDILRGEEGGDHLVGGRDNDMLFGGLGKDRLNGSRGDDYLSGEEGNDRLNGSWGDDVLIGGGGKDRFLFKPEDGSDIIEDFEIGVDQLVFKNISDSEVSHTIDDTGLWLHYNGGNILVAGIFEMLPEDSFNWV